MLRQLGRLRVPADRSAGLLSGSPCLPRDCVVHRAENLAIEAVHATAIAAFARSRCDRSDRGAARFWNRPHFVGRKVSLSIRAATAASVGALIEDYGHWLSLLQNASRARGCVAAEL